jgi:hypothetical protein
MTDSVDMPNRDAAGVEASETSSAFMRTLNAHGYVFQYSVLELARALYSDKLSSWMFEVAEFPVEVRGFGTRIDFLLRHHSAPVCLLAERKRANPALKDWCFARAPYVRRNRSREKLLIECAVGDGTSFFHASAVCGAQIANAYHIAREISCREKGDSGGSGRGVIEEAATQICRGLNGLLEFLAKHPQSLLKEGRVLLLPVIFTTARLWTSDANLAGGDLVTGSLNAVKDSLTQVDWLFYQYPQSPGIKHSWSPKLFPEALGELSDSEYIRSIAVVSAAGIEDFMKWSSNPGNYLLL